jgi:hypothetical protein
MSEKAGKEKGMWGIQWNNRDWAYVGEVAKQIGLSRSEFVRRSTLSAAKAMTLGVPPYSVDGAKATPQNTRINLFSGEAGTKLDTGGGQDAAPRLRSNGVAKGGTTSDLQAHRPRRAVSRKS